MKELRAGGIFFFYFLCVHQNMIFHFSLEMKNLSHCVMRNMRIHFKKRLKSL